MHKEVKGGMPAGYRVPKANKGAHAFRDAASKITASERLLMAAVKPKADVSRDIACPFSGPDGRGFLQLPDASSGVQHKPSAAAASALAQPKKEKIVQKKAGVTSPKPPGAGRGRGGR